MPGLTAVVLALPALAQQQTADLTGQVQDSSGAAIPGATVSLRDPAKGFNVTTKSDSKGEYLLPLLQPADDYQITVSVAGFKADVKQNVILKVRSPRRSISC